MQRLLTLLATLAWLVGAGPAPTPQQPGIVRVGGDYKVASIERIDDNTLRVEFQAVKPTGKFDTLRLESDHIHVSVKVGQEIRLSAEILSQRGATAEVAQMVLFLPSAQGRIPVWMLSNKAPAHDLRAVRYLEMHAPNTDYMVM